jgi:putative ABC transport system permease protein
MARATRSGATRLVQVSAVEPGYPFYGVIRTVPEGAWRRLHEDGGVLGDPGLLLALGVGVGDTLALGEASFVVLGSVVDFPGDVSLRSAFGPRVFVPADRLADTRLVGFGSRVRYEAYLKLPPGASAQRLADRHRGALGAERVTIRTVSEDQRRLNETLSRLGNYLGLVALVALLLGGLGVASAVHVFIERKLETVAVLRCLGASARTVLAVYLTQAAAVGLAGSAVGVLLGAAAQALLPRVLRSFLPVDVAYGVSWSAAAGGLALGLWVATIFSLLPLLAIRHVSPLVVLRRPFEGAVPSRRDAARTAAALGLVASVVVLAVLQAGRVVPGLAFAGGIGASLGVLALAALILTRGLRRVFPARLPYLFRQGLANLYRPANQTLAVILALGFGAFLLSTLVLVQANLLRDLRVDGGATRPNLVFFDIQPDQRADVEAAIRKAGATVGPAVPIVPMRIQSVKGRAVAETLGAAQDEEASRARWALRREYRSSYRDAAAPSERIVAGAWWAPGEWAGRRDGPVPISVGDTLARELEVGLGDTIVWDVQGLPVASQVASIREVDWARFEPNFFVVFPDGPLAEAPQSYVSLTRVADSAARAGLQRQVVEAHPNVSALDLSQVQQAVESILDRAALAIRFMALFSLAAGAVVLAGAVASSRTQRVREGALLRTLGATRRQLLHILFAEYASLGLLSACTAILLATGAGWALVRFAFDGRFALPAGPLLGLGGGVLVLTVVVGLWGSTDAFRRTPLEVLRTE